MYKIYVLLMCIIWYTYGMTNDMCLITAIMFGLIDVLENAVEHLRRSKHEG